MNWYSTFDRIQSVRVMGVVDSFRMTPFCRSSAFTLTAPNRLAVITAIAMIPGTKNSMNRYFFVSIDVSADLMNGGFSGHFLVYPASTMFRTCILCHPKGAGVVYLRDGNGCIGIVQRQSSAGRTLHKPLGIMRRRFRLLSLAYWVALNGRGDLGNPESSAAPDSLTSCGGRLSSWSRSCTSRSKILLSLSMKMGRTRVSGFTGKAIPEKHGRLLAIETLYAHHEICCNNAQVHFAPLLLLGLTSPPPVAKPHGSLPFSRAVAR